MDLTPDQLHLFQSSRRFEEFRGLFSKREDAFAAYANAAQRLTNSIKPTHTIEWRYIYHDRESGFLMLLFLLTAPLGIHYTKHQEFRFLTLHELTPQQSRQLFWGRSLGSLCYHVCFVLLIVVGVGIAFGLIGQLLGGFSWKMTLLTGGCLLAFVGTMIAAGKTRSLGLPEQLKPIAKDTFDLLSIQRIKAR